MDTLLYKARCGDAEAFISLMEKEKMTLRRVAYGYLGNDEDVADAIQDTILAAYEHIGSLKKDEYFRTWLVRILINNCTRIWRTNKKKVRLCEENFAEDIGMEDADMKFKELLLSLPEDSRVIFQLYYGEQFTTKEIADVLHMKENTVKSRLHRGKERLYAQLQQG